MYTESFFENYYTHHINRGLSLYPLNKLKEYNVILDFDVFLKKYNTVLQRPLVWDDLQKEQFILSLLRSKNINVITAIERRYNDEKVIYRIIDGKQRLNTILSYINNEFYVTHKGEKIYYSDIENKRVIHNNPYMKWDIHYDYKNNPISDDTLIDIFEELNFLGTKVDIEHFKKIKSIQNGE